MTKPPLALHAEVTDAAGARTRWDANSPDAAMRPQNLSFRTARMTGFADASVTLARRIDTDYIDLHLLDDFALIGDDGSIAYEGRVSALPRSMQQSHHVTVQAAGWMAHTKDRKFTEIYVDRDLGRWGGAARQRQVDLLVGNYTQAEGPSVQPDETNGLPSLMLGHASKWASPIRPIAEAWYDAGPGNLIGSIYYDIVETGDATTADADWDLSVRTVTNDQGSVNSATTGDIWATVPAAGTLTDSSPQRYALISFFYVSTPGGADGYEYTINVRRLAVFGDHGLTKRGTAPDQGLYASDVIEHIVQNHCPMLDTAGVQATSYPIPHLVFADPTDPYEAMLRCNAFHLWDLAVWENRTLHYGPVDMADYDWQIRQHDHGVQFDLQGDSTEQLANGICVTFQNLATGKQDRVTPDTNPELADADPENPANKHGITAWTEVTLSAPTTSDAAVQMGRSLLGEFTTPRAPGTITVQGHIRDRAGHWQQAWKVRAGDTIAITNHPNDRPRLITETTYNAENHTVQISVEGQPRRLDAVLDRLSTSLQAANLG